MVPTLPRGNRAFGAPAPAAVDWLLLWNLRHCSDRRSGRPGSFPRWSMGTISWNTGTIRFPRWFPRSRVGTASSALPRRLQWIVCYRGICGTAVTAGADAGVRPTLAHGDDQIPPRVPTLPRGNRAFGAPAPAAVDWLLLWNLRQCSDRRSGRPGSFPRWSVGTIRTPPLMVPTLPRGNRVFGAPAPSAVDR